MKFKIIQFSIDNFLLFFTNMFKTDYKNIKVRV